MCFFKKITFILISDYTIFQMRAFLGLKPRIYTRNYDENECAQISCAQAKDGEMIHTKSTLQC